MFSWLQSVRVTWLTACFHTEAAVERGFKSEGRIYTKYRASMKEVTVQDQLMVNQNYLKLFRPDVRKTKVEQAERRCEKRKAAVTSEIAELLVKRVAPTKE